MTELRFYLSLFIRRLPAFLLVAAIVAAISVVVAVSLPPAYESRTRLIVESPQIPDELAPSTVRLPGKERLQIIENRLLTRPNMLDIARRLNVLADQEDMSPDEIVEAMESRTVINSNARRNEATIMEIVFEARTAKLAAQVLNEYLQLIQQSDVSFRQGRAGQGRVGLIERVELLLHQVELFEKRVELVGLDPEILQHLVQLANFLRDVARVDRGDTLGK